MSKRREVKAARCGGAQIISRLSLQQDLQTLTWITLSMDICLDVKRGGGYSDIFIHTLALAIFGGSKFEFQYFGGFQKSEYFGGMNILWLSFWGHYKIGLDLEVISMHFNVKEQNG